MSGGDRRGVVTRPVGAKMGTYWKSPCGKVYADPTHAMCEALIRNARIRHQWCPRAGDMSEHARISFEWYVNSPKVRRRVDAILADAGYIECETEDVGPGEPYTEETKPRILVRPGKTG